MATVFYYEYEYVYEKPLANTLQFSPTTTVILKETMKTSTNTILNCSEYSHT